MNSGNHSSCFAGEDPKPIKAINASELAKDEAIKCTRAELLTKEFVVIGDKSFPELLRITFQDLERGSRDIIFQKKIQNNDEVKFSFPHDLVKETEMAVLIVMKGEKMFFKKIDIVQEE
ncbi:MAG: hypothetical protein KDD29_08795 [Flavobacteriales bacterium]|nr:hypothetical protein [Flavobacteriales bacterium]